MTKTIKRMIPSKFLVALAVVICCFFCAASGEASATEYNNPTLPVFDISYSPEIACTCSYSFSAVNFYGDYIITYNGSPLSSSTSIPSVTLTTGDSLYYYSHYYKCYVVISDSYVYLRPSLASSTSFGSSFTPYTSSGVGLLNYNGIYYLCSYKIESSKFSFWIPDRNFIYRCNFV